MYLNSEFLFFDYFNSMDVIIDWELFRVLLHSLGNVVMCPKNVAN